MFTQDTEHAQTLAELSEAIKSLESFNIEQVKSIKKAIDNIEKLMQDMPANQNIGLGLSHSLEIKNDKLVIDSLL